VRARPEEFAPAFRLIWRLTEAGLTTGGSA
jgi:hypothetical protein